MKRWRVTIEGSSQAQPFLQNILVVAPDPGTAESLAVGAFEQGGDEFVGVVEVEPVGGRLALTPHVQSVEGRIFFGPAD